MNKKRANLRPLDNECRRIVGQNIRKWRKIRSVKTADLALLLYQTDSIPAKARYYRMERGLSFITAEDLASIRGRLEISFDDFFVGFGGYEKICGPDYNYNPILARADAIAFVDCITVELEQNDLVGDKSATDSLVDQVHSPHLHRNGSPSADDAE